MQNSKLVIVVGSPGAGKTLIVDSIKTDKRYRIINVGTQMEEMGIEKGLIKHRDQIRYLDFETINRLRVLVFKRVAEMKGNIVLDTHMSVERRGKYVPGLPYSLLRYLKNLVGMIYIDATTEEILARRHKDKTRSREAEDRENVDMQRIMNVSMLAYCSIHLNISIYTIHNKENSIKETVKAFKNALKEMTGG